VIDLAITEDDDAPMTLIAHRPDCPVVERHRVAGRPVMVMLGCENADNIKLHSCLYDQA
jgi:hypothetical protein